MTACCGGGQIVIQVVTSVVLLVSSSYAGTCAEVSGSVRCTDDVGHNSTLESVDHAIFIQSSRSTVPETSSIPREMATYPPDMKFQGIGRQPSPQNPDEEADRNTLKMWIPRSQSSSGSVR
jgi:hypothetical protein